MTVQDPYGRSESLKTTFIIKMENIVMASNIQIIYKALVILSVLINSDKKIGNANSVINATIDQMCWVS